MSNRKQRSVDALDVVTEKSTDEGPRFETATLGHQIANLVLYNVYFIFDGNDDATASLRAKLDTTTLFELVGSKIKHEGNISLEPPEPPEPPALAEFLVGFLVAKRHRESLLAEHTENFDADIAAGMSVGRARLRYWACTGRDILDLIGPALKRIKLVAVLLAWPSLRAWASRNRHAMCNQYRTDKANAALWGAFEDWHEREKWDEHGRNISPVGRSKSQMIDEAR